MGVICVRNTIGIYTGLTPTLHHSAFRNDQCLYCPEFVETQITGQNHCDSLRQYGRGQLNLVWSFMGSFPG